jgi:hypothetical protein
LIVSNSLGSKNNLHNVQAPLMVGSLNEPKVPECKPTQSWKVRLIKIGTTGRYEIDVQYRTRLGKIESLRVDAGLRSESDRIRRELDSRNARLPFDKKVALTFIENLIRQVPATPFIACASPVFCDGGMGFVMPNKQYGSARGKFIWDVDNASPEFGAIQGQLSDYVQGVLNPALSSPYLTLAILIPLASSLLGYVAQRRKVRLLTETAIIHFAGESSSGKTTLGCVAQSVSGSPEIDTDYDGTDRGIAEQAYRRSHLALVIDDTESAGLSDEETWAKMQKFAQRVPRGRSKAISGRARRSDLPELGWTVFGISSGPESLADLAARLHRQRQGDRVRLLDVILPSLATGGIFGSSVTAGGTRPAVSAKLIKRIEETIATCHGVLFDAWMSFLVSHDVADRAIDLVAEFVKATAGGENGLEQRFAAKFAVPYAAGVIAVEAGLLRWPTDWPWRAVWHCYMNSRRARDPIGVDANRALKQLAGHLTSVILFPQFMAQRGQYPTWRPNQIGIRVVAGGHMTTWFAKERLALVCGGDRTIGERVFAKLVELKCVQASTNTSGSQQIRVRSAPNVVEKVRLWMLDITAFKSWIGNNASRRSG